MAAFTAPPDAPPAASARPAAPRGMLAAAPATRRAQVPIGAWRGLQQRAGALLGAAPQPGFAAELHRLQADLFELVDADADLALLVLVDAAAAGCRHYSASHALLVAVVCELAARQLPAWPAACRPSLRSAALAMNVAMTALQDTLALQDAPPSAEQRAQIDDHAERGAALLRAAGVGDELLLGAVAHHHATPPGPLAALPVAQQLARLIQRADIFAARHSPRRSRQALSGTAAAQAAFIDERKQADEAGMAIVKATGIHPPGSCVQLANGEVAVVLRRGPLAHQPLVASVVARSGIALVEPAVRDTRQRHCRVGAGVAPHEVALRPSLERLLLLLA